MAWRMVAWTQKRVSPTTVRTLIRLWAGAVAATLIVFAGVTARGAWSAVAEHVTTGNAPAPRIVRDVPAPATPGGDASNAPTSLAAPAPGVTGTIALPPLPAFAATMANEAPITGVPTAAAPFSLAGRSMADRARAMECLTAAIYYEAASEPDAGQQAVAQVVLNRARHPAFPATVCGVVYQGSERSGCQFSFACDGAMARVPSRAGWARAARVAAAALAGRVYAPVGLATHYHTYAVTPAWNRALVMTDVEGAHFFHRWKGWWGTAAAFRQRYVGGEPVPGPHTPLVAAVPAMPQPMPTAIAAPIATLAATLVTPPLPSNSAVVARPTRPAPPATGVTPVADLADPSLARSGEVLDRWKDTGQPVR
jgi:spore germination cell wall hydrolase CwlJ-like protein